MRASFRSCTTLRGWERRRAMSYVHEDVHDVMVLMSTAKKKAQH